MLKLKLKQVLLAQGKTKPLNWLRTECGLSYRKAYNLLHNKQKSIAFEDLTKICYVMQCTPDEIFYWDNTSKYMAMEWHPCRAKLHEPRKDANWILRVQALNPDRVEVLQKVMEDLESEIRNDANTIFQAVKQKEKEQKEEAQDKDLDTETPLD